MLRLRSRLIPLGFIEPCLPTIAAKPPSGPGWLPEIKHDGFRTLVPRAGDRVRVLTRNGIDWTERFPMIVRAARSLDVRSCLIDGEIIAARPEDGLGDFDLLRRRKGHVTLIAFDLLELDGEDLRRQPIEARKRTPQKLLRRTAIGLEYNEHIEDEDAARVFAHACRLGFEGIASSTSTKRRCESFSQAWAKNHGSIAAGLSCAARCTEALLRLFKRRGLGECINTRLRQWRLY